VGRSVSSVKKCRRCGETKPRTEFTRSTGLPNAVHSNCKPCAAEVARARNGRDPERLRLVNRRSKLKRNFGLSLEEYDRMLQAQANACAICGSTEAGGRGGRAGSFHVDHCHATGRVRGLLCHSCNTGIGHLRDSIPLLQRAVVYLSRGG